MTSRFQGMLIHRGFMLIVFVLFIIGNSACDKQDDPVELVFTSWRIDDTAEMDRINAVYTRLNPNITIRFDPYDPMVYDSIALEKLSKGKGADLIFLWS